MTWASVLSSISGLLNAVTKVAGYVAAYLFGRSQVARNSAETSLENAKDAIQIDEAVAGLSDSDLDRELRRRP